MHELGIEVEFIGKDAACLQSDPCLYDIILIIGPEVSYSYLLISIYPPKLMVRR